MTGKVTDNFPVLTEIPVPTLSEALRCIAEHVAAGPTEEEQHTARLLVSCANRLDRLEAALRPFAKFSSGFGRTARDDSWVLCKSPSGKREITMGDVRVAEDVLEPRNAS